MKDIQIFAAPKYDDPAYTQVEEGIYEYEGEYFCSLSFVQEPEYGEGESAADIAQYPLEDILDKYYAYVADFYTDLNTADSETCYLEFGAADADDISQLLEIVGKHVYNKTVSEDGKEYIKLVTE